MTQHRILQAGNRRFGKRIQHPGIRKIFPVSSHEHSSYQPLGQADHGRLTGKLPGQYNRPPAGGVRPECLYCKTFRRE